MSWTRRRYGKILIIVSVERLSLQNRKSPRPNWKKRLFLNLVPLLLSYGMSETVQGMEIVVFERLLAGSVTGSALEYNVPIAVHEDIKDMDQTIKVPVTPFNPPHTGVDDHMGLLLTTMLTSGAGAIWILRKRKRS